MGVFSNNPEYFRRGGKYYTGRSIGRIERSGDVEVSGIAETSEYLGRIMSNDPNMGSWLKSVIRTVLKEARKNLSRDAMNYMKSDPRKASRAVKYSVYKSIWGGSLSILQKKSGTAGARYYLQRNPKLRPGQRGGNRILRDNTDERNRLEYYYGADRGYILRFINSGTVKRVTRYGNRGAIRQSNWFGHTASRQMDTAAERVAAAINEYVKQQTNG